MKFEQRNPLPLPESGRFAAVESKGSTRFDWGYQLEEQTLLNLYEKGKAATWNASDLAWDTPVDMYDIFARRHGEHAEAGNALMQPPRRLSGPEAAELDTNLNAWLLSQFLHGEQGALLAAGRIIQGAPDEETKFYAANQAADEARHVEVYQRYLTEKLDRSFAVNENLQTLLYQTVSDSRWDMTFLGMQIMVEGLALAAFGLMRLQLPEEPLIQDITTRIMADEARHVAFGVLVLEQVYAELTEAERREREDFAIEATHLMHDRLLMEDIFERMNLDVPVWIDWAKNTAFMKGFRQMLFAKIVPNVRRLGLLTPRVRGEYERLGLLKFENLSDSTQDSEPPPPEEMIKLIAAMREGADAGG